MIKKAKNKIIMDLLFINKGQSIVEYTVFIVCLILALMAMQAYVKRGMQGGLRSSADSLGQQYDPGVTVSDFTTNFISNTTTNSVTEEAGGMLISTITVTTNLEEQARKGTETVGE